MTKKVTKDVDYVSINFAENGFIIEYSGMTAEDDYRSVKRLVSDFDSLVKELELAIKASSYGE